MTDHSTLTVQPARTLRRGFTVLELGMVLVILGVIIAIALPTFLHQRAAAQDAQAHAALRTVVSQARASASKTTELFPADLMATLAADEKSFTLIVGASDSAQEVSLVSPLPLDASDAYLPATDLTRAAFAALSASGTCWFVVDDLHGGTRYGRDSSETAYLNCNADRVKLAVDSDDFAAEFPDAGAIWFDSLSAGLDFDSAVTVPAIP